MARETIYKKEIFSQVNKDNLMLLDDYILELKANKKSSGTIYQYTADIKAFYCWIYEYANNKSVIELKKKIFRNFVLYLQDRGCSAARINRMQCSVRNLLEFACDNEDEYDYEVNVMRKIKGLKKETVREIIFLTDEEVTLIYNTLLKEERYQEALLSALAYDSASRRKECYQVKKEDITEDGNITKNYVIGKRGKKFKLFYFDRTKEAYKLWMAQRGEDNIDSLWVVGKDENKRPASYESLYYWCISWRKILNNEKAFNNNSFRHSAAENLNKGNHYILKVMGKEKFDLKELKALLNHSDLSTTDGYLKQDNEEELLMAFGLK